MRVVCMLCRHPAEMDEGNGKVVPHFGGELNGETLVCKFDPPTIPADPYTTQLLVTVLRRVVDDCDVTVADRHREEWPDLWAVIDQAIEPRATRKEAE